MEQVKKTFEEMTKNKVSGVNINSINQIKKFIELKNMGLNKDIIYIIEKNNITSRVFDFKKFKFICLYKHHMVLFTEPLMGLIKSITNDVECPICLCAPHKETVICRQCCAIICKKCIAGMIETLDGELYANTKINCPLCRFNLNRSIII